MSHEQYGLFNILPEGKTIDDIPKELQWLYIEPFQKTYSLTLACTRVEEINRSRKKDFDRPGYHFPVTTFCEVRQRTVTYTDWS